MWKPDINNVSDGYLQGNYTLGKIVDLDGLLLQYGERATKNGTAALRDGRTHETKPVITAFVLRLRPYTIEHLCHDLRIHF